jgi:hypothetical protein
MSFKASELTLMKSGLLVAAAAIMALPGISYAATYAYVNEAGNVATVTAENPNAAMITAPNIAVHSGVLLLDSAEDLGVVGDSVNGI